MSSLSADRKLPLDYGVQIRFIKDLDDTGGGYVERSRGTGAVGGAGGGGTPQSSKYGVAVRVQGISGQPYVVLKDGKKGDSYGVQLKTQPQAQSPDPRHSSTFDSLSASQRDGAQTPNPYGSIGEPSSPEEEAVEFGSPLRRPPGDGQAGSQGEVERATAEKPISAPKSSSLEKKDSEELNEAGLRRVGLNDIGTAVNGAGVNGPLSGNKGTSAESFPENLKPATSKEEPVEAIDTKSLAPINKLINKFNSNSPASTVIQTRGRSRARTRLQFDEQKRSRSVDSFKEEKEEPPSSPAVNPYAPMVTPPTTTTLNSPKPTAYSSLGRSSTSVAKVPTVPASKPLTFNQSPKNFVAKELTPAIPQKPMTPDLLRSQNQNTDAVNGEEAQVKQAIYSILKEGSFENETALRRKASLIHERFSGVKTPQTALSHNSLKNVLDQTERKNKQLQQQLEETKRELQHAQDQLLELRMEKEGIETRLHQQEDQLARLQDDLRRVSGNTTETDSLHMDLMTIQAELSEAVMMRQKLEESLHMRERELTALKGALKDEVASHDREMEALREQYSQDMEALQLSMEHVSKSHQEIEEERQKVNASILTLEDELDSYKEQGDQWKEQLRSVKQELLLAQQEKKDLKEKLHSVRKQTSETGSSAQELQRVHDDLNKASLKLAEQKAELVKKEEQLRSLKKTSEDKEKQLKAEIENLKDQSIKDKEELSKVSGKTQESLAVAQDAVTTKESSVELQEANTRLRERLSRMSMLHSSVPDIGGNKPIEEENLSLRMQLEEALRRVARMGQDKEDLNRRLEEREKEREVLRRGKSDLEEQKRLLDRALEKLNKEMEMVMGDSRQSVHTLQSQLNEFRDRSRKELQEAQRLSKDRLAELQRTQNSLKAVQEDDKVKTLEIELDEEKSGTELLNDRITRTREQMDQLRYELMQERSARHDLEMDKSSLERQVKELKSRMADMEGLSRPSAGVTMLESKIQELENQLRSEEREKNSILAAQRRMERKLKDVNATLDQERNQHAVQRDQLSLRVKSLKRQVDEREGEVERLEGVRRKVLRELEEQLEVKEALQAKVIAVENELKRKIQTQRPALGSTLSSEDEDGYFDSNNITSILKESQLQTSNC
ncbi:cingulin isoform X2 [Hoplias malabaricus]|uniref:cingulin isoform X2 n=1 Tax=Hoplias malabaricus TaxID=27720 RepID=UPI003461B4D1